MGILRLLLRVMQRGPFRAGQVDRRPGLQYQFQRHTRTGRTVALGRWLTAPLPTVSRGSRCPTQIYKP